MKGKREPEAEGEVYVAKGQLENSGEAELVYHPERDCPQLLRLDSDVVGMPLSEAEDVCQREANCCGENRYQAIQLRYNDTSEVLDI